MFSHAHSQIPSNGCMLQANSTFKIQLHCLHLQFLQVEVEATLILNAKYLKGGHCNNRQPAVSDPVLAERLD